MKVAYHFNADYKSFRGNYGFPIEKIVFISILSNNRINISSTIFVGDLPLHLPIIWFSILYRGKKRETSDKG